ncbi:hypothetical protein QBC40DRAFT_324916 [Triangularia verruculosa]|uniref:Uncharacterized protein n=1 Tax=Triangularia verruculosa TaxID=2587418 RepID=A0AAN6XKB9_9PEZI|nr:hypothetical protein QBC40DRAFT_324916 [Triangularia verruculosa]
MKNLGTVALSGAALLQVASAACCRTNKCLKAVVLAGDDGLADCSAIWIVTVTPSAVTLTETLTVVESAVETALFTETLTETAATETVLFTQTTTTTAATQTDVILETMTVPVTTIVVESATPVTTTSFVYRAQMTARDVAPELPEYATAVCADWDKYLKACSCVGVESLTVTASAVTETITVTAGDAITTTVATLSSTQTDVVTVTETTSATVTDIVSVTESATVTDTVTASEATTVRTTETPTIVVPLTCKPTGSVFRASVSPFHDGSTRWMNVVNNNIVAWQSFAGGSPSATSYTAIWTIDSNGYLELKNPTGNVEVLAAYMSKSATGPSAQVVVRTKSVVEAAVAAGTHERVKVCINPTNNEVIMSALGRSNMLECGNGLYLSRGLTGSDIRSDCHLITPKDS